MGVAPRFERRRRIRRLSDAPAPVPPPDRREADEGGAGRWRARGIAALAALALASILLACLLLFGWLDEAGRERVYLVLAAFAAVLWVAMLPLADRVSRLVLAAPRRPRPGVVRAIRRAIEQREFELHYQPQIDIETGCPSGVEALLRWRRDGELVPPAEFLGDAEASSVIGPLTDHILELAITQASRWHRAGRKLRLAINLSAANLGDFAVVERLRGLLAAHDVPAAMITLEVTETAVLEEPEQTRAVLDALAELGLSISVDDFGTGYSSLLWLRVFPVAEVKIDRVFVSSMQADGEAYVSGVIRLAHDLGLSVVAEGVEDDPTLQMLQELGCDVAQGYLFAKPLPVDRLEAWLEDKSETPWAPKRRELTLSPDEASLAEARRLVDEIGAELGFEDTDLWDMKVAATEALTNAIDHAPRRPDGLIHLRISQDHGHILLDVWGGGRAEGAPVVHHPDGGRGISIMTALMDHVEMRREADDTLIRLAKRRSTPRQASS